MCPALPCRETGHILVHKHKSVLSVFAFRRLLHHLLAANDVDAMLHGHAVADVDALTTDVVDVLPTDRLTADGLNAVGNVVVVDD